MKFRIDQGYGTIIVSNKSYIGQSTLEKFCSLAEILTIINSFANERGNAQCTHLRGYTKTLQENVDFEVNGETVFESKKTVSTSKKAPKTTFRLGVNEDERKMREITPLPYEKQNRLIKIEEQDYISPDEEGDDDDYV